MCIKIFPPCIRLIASKPVGSGTQVKAIFTSRASLGCTAFVGLGAQGVEGSSGTEDLGSSNELGLYDGSLRFCKACWVHGCLK